MKKISTTILFVLFTTILLLTFVSSAPPITSIISDTGYIIEPTIKDYLRTGSDHEFEIHVFNKSNGVPVIEGITCYMHLYHQTGEEIYIGIAQEVTTLFDYSFNLNGSNFTSRGFYQAKFQCNSTNLGGGGEIEFGVNDYGEALTEEATFTHNYSMIFLMILFTFALFGLIKTDNLALKFALYWVCHIFFIMGTFAVWQFNQGYTLNFMATAGIFKILFYFSIFASFPMIILSLAWIFYIHLMNEEIKRLMDKGFDEDEAVSRAKSKMGRKRK